MRNFLNRHFPVKNIVNEDDFRKAVKESIEAQWDAQSRNQLHDQIYHQLVDHTHIEFPENFLKRGYSRGRKNLKLPKRQKKNILLLQTL